MSSGIYKIENKLNHKKYIGLSINLEERLQYHKKYITDHRKTESNKLLYLAINKYGLDNFDFEIIEYCESNQLGEREKYWIKYYDCCILDGSDKGYNMTRGGEYGYLTTDYEKAYNLWLSGLNENEVAKEMNISIDSVIRALNYYEVSTHERRSRAVKKYAKKKKTTQYDLNGNYINVYESAKAASLATGIDYSSICRACNHSRNCYTASGYKWSWENV